MTEKEEKAHPSHILKFLLAPRKNCTFGFTRHTSQPFAIPKEPFLTIALFFFEYSFYICQILSNLKL
jgi:hypothetical protein